MRQWLRSHLTYANVMVTILGFIVLGGSAFAATGGTFILGQPNSAGTPTQLSSATTNAAGAFKVANTNTTTTGRGITAQGGAGGFGLWASGGNVAKNTAAIHGQSGAGNAVEGFSTANPASGVYGQDNNANSYGVAGHSDNGVAVVGDSASGWAIQALGNATQTRTGGGFVKAMAFIDPLASVASNKIMQCFNSQLLPSQATNGDCGITYNRTAGGKYTLNFGFRVDDRFASVTAQAAALTSADPPGSPSNALAVTTFDSVLAAYVDVPFYIVVF
jgi:hypothetical protein